MDNMSRSHREQLLGILYEDGDYLYCIHCERAYPAGKYRTVIDDDPIDPTGDGTMQLCPYEDCDGDAVIDATEWWKVSADHPDYPETPEEGRVYPLNET